MTNQSEHGRGFLGGWRGLKELLPNNTGVWKQTFSSLKSRNYRLYFYGQMISLIGSFVQSIALSWLIYRVTGSVMLLATVSFVSQIPSFFLTPVTGVLVDRIGRKRVLIATQLAFMIQALILALLTLVFEIEVWQIIGLSLFIGLVHAFDMPARQAITIDLVDNKENLSNAIALNSAMFNAARLIGPSIGGVLVGLIGEGFCFLINGLSYVTVLYSLNKIRIKEVKKQTGTHNIVRDMNDGILYAYRSMPLRSALIMVGLISFFGFSILVFMPAFVKDILHRGSDALGFVMASIGAGALVAALYLAARKSVLGLGKIIMLNTFLLGVCQCTLAFMDAMLPVILVGFPIGFALIASVASMNTQLQMLSDEAYRGRVMSFYTMALMGVVPIGAMVLGYLEKFVGLSYLFLINGVVCVLAALVYEIARPALRRQMRKVYVEKGLVHEIATGMASTIDK